MSNRSPMCWRLAAVVGFRTCLGILARDAFAVQPTITPLDGIFELKPKDNDLYRCENTPVIELPGKPTWPSGSAGAIEAHAVELYQHERCDVRPYLVGRS